MNQSIATRFGENGNDSTSGSELVLNVAGLRTYFHTPSGVAKALDGVSLSARKAATLGVVGASGSGKTVLARSIMGLVREPGRIVAGRIDLLNHNLLEATPAQLTALRGRVMSLIVSNPRSRLNPVLSVGTQIANVLRAKQQLTRRNAFERAIELLSSVAIGDPARVARSLPHELSGGMCQRVVIVMALANSPTLLLADEPTAGLDVTVQRQVLELMMKLVNDMQSALVLMTRDLGIIGHYADRVAVLSEGKIVEERPVAEFFADPKHPRSVRLLESAFAARGQERAQ